jgi:hypothetical protein
MGTGMFSGMLKNLETAGENAADKRREGFDFK